jgi:ketopantoate reductase
MATRLALTGNEVSVIDVGAQLEAIAERGLRLVWADGAEQAAKVRTLRSAREAGPQDLVILAVKAHLLEQATDGIASMLVPDTMVMTVQNGMPWWYFERSGCSLDGSALRNLDPSGALKAAIDPTRIIGCVVYAASEVSEPGVVHHIEGDRFPIGELNGAQTERIGLVSDAFNAAGLKARILEDIRSELWLKALGTLAFNPISALTHATLVEICRFEETRQLAATMMEEAKAVADKLGVTLRHTIERRIQGAEAVGMHKTSMLQDVEAGRSLEVEALLGSIIEMARLTDTPMPASRVVYACVKLLNEVILARGQGIGARGALA